MIAVLDRAAIAGRIPHSGSMCLLDGVLEHGAAHIRCRAVSHRDADNPLRLKGTLPSACAIEYAAQAMALHGALAAPEGTPPKPGFLASVRGVQLLVSRLDDIDSELIVSANRQAGDERQAMYTFALHDAAGRLLVDGRATVILNALP